MHTQILLVGNRAQQHIRDTALYMFRCLNCSIELYFMAPLFAHCPGVCEVIEGFEGDLCGK